MTTDQAQTENQTEAQTPAANSQAAAPDRQPSAPPKPDPKPADPAKKRRRMVLLIGFALVAAIAVAIWWLIARNYEDTDDAQVNGHINPISSRVAGAIQAVYVENNQYVRAGQPLVDLDPRDYQVALDQAKATYDQASDQAIAERPNLPITVVGNRTDESTNRAGVTAAQAALSAAQFSYDNAAAQLESAQANNAKAQADLKRYAQLVEKQEVANSDYDQYLAAAKAQQATVDADKATVAAAAQTVDQRRAELSEQQDKLDQVLKNASRQVSIRNATIQSRQAGAELAAAQQQQAKLNLGYTHIVSPVNGIISQRTAEVGAQISAGQQLMMVVQIDDLWVTANFKETQLRRMRKGQSVRIHVDALDRDFDGYVQNMPAASGDITSVLPPENATGNYVKVVQRLPVRIAFKPNQPGLDRLRPGMSVEPKVHLN